MKTYAIIENDIVINLLDIDDKDAPDEETGAAFVAALGFGEAVDRDREQSPTPGGIGDQFNRTLGRFQDSPDEEIEPVLRPTGKGQFEIDPTRESFYNNETGRWDIRDVETDS